MLKQLEATYNESVDLVVGAEAATFSVRPASQSSVKRIAFGITSRPKSVVHDRRSALDGHTEGG
jgi:hypothetical protein